MDRIVPNIFMICVLFCCLELGCNDNTDTTIWRTRAYQNGIRFEVHGSCGDREEFSGIRKVWRKNSTNGDLIGFSLQRFSQGMEDGVQLEVKKDGLFVWGARNGQIHGTYLEYYRSGSIITDDLFHATRPKAIREYRMGMLEGKVAAWWENGNVREIAHYKGGRRNGRTTIWYEYGGIALQERFQHGIRVGARDIWGTDGKYTREEQRVAGKLGNRDSAEEKRRDVPSYFFRDFELKRGKIKMNENYRSLAAASLNDTPANSGVDEKTFDYALRCNDLWNWE